LRARWLGAACLAGSVLAGSGFGGGAATRVTGAQLALMVVPHSALNEVPDTYRPIRTGPQTNAQYAADSLDPRVTAASLARAGRLSGLGLGFTLAHAQAAKAYARHVGLVALVTEVELFRGRSAACAAMTGADRDRRVLVGSRLRNGATLVRAAPFTSPLIGDGASGWSYEVAARGERTYVTRVEFCYGQIFATAYSLRADPENASADMTSLAQLLASRIRQVLSGGSVPSGDRADSSSGSPSSATAAWPKTI
jgi:hypothetical protein